MLTCGRRKFESSKSQAKTSNTGSSYIPDDKAAGKVNAGFDDTTPGKGDVTPETDDVIPAENGHLPTKNGVAHLPTKNGAAPNVNGNGVSSANQPQEQKSGQVNEAFDDNTTGKDFIKPNPENDDTAWRNNDALPEKDDDVTPTKDDVTRTPDDVKTEKDVTA